MREKISQVESSHLIRFDALPPDMQVLLDDFIRGCGRDVSIPALLPLVEVAVDNIPVVPLDPFDRGPDYALRMDLELTPPIVVAEGHFMDGKHRVYAARSCGRLKLTAIDLTGLIDPVMLERNSMGQLLVIDPEADHEMIAALRPR